MGEERETCRKQQMKRNDGERDSEKDRPQLERESFEDEVEAVPAEVGSYRVEKEDAQRGRSNALMNKNASEHFADLHSRDEERRNRQRNLNKGPRGGVNREQLGILGVVSGPRKGEILRRVEEKEQPFSSEGNVAEQDGEREEVQCAQDDVNEENCAEEQDLNVEEPEDLSQLREAFVN